MHVGIGNYGATPCYMDADRRFTDLGTTMSCYSSSKYMLCVFHAIVMAYFEHVHPKLPHK